MISKKKRADKDAAVRGEIASRLYMFAELLNRKQIVIDVAPLNKAATQCKGYPLSGKWGYSVERLIFRHLGGFKAFQKGFETQDATLEFSVQIEGSCDYAEGSDPLSLLALDIVLSGFYEGKNNVESASAAWHLDRHISKDGDGEPEFAHPIYHFSFGGTQLEKSYDPQLLEILLADTPRISHPPMDAILGIDFVITNFIGSSITQIRNESFYISTVNMMQNNLWKPYVDSLHSFWLPGQIALPWLPEKIWTQLMSA